MSLSDWMEGARPRTLPASLAPVAAGTAVAIREASASAPRALLAAALALALQVGVNFANDYSDGVRGADDVRIGPARLTGGGKASPEAVRLAAFASFAAGGVAGLALVALSGHRWLIVVGAAAIAAAWFYTGGRRPYGYMGLGEVFVFVFFGPVATLGTTYAQAHRVPWQAWLASCGVGLIACGLLMVNNLRDIPTDAKVGKRTLAVRLGEARSRLAYAAMVGLPIPASAAFWPDLGWWTLLVLLPGSVLAWAAIRPVLSGAAGADLIRVLKLTGSVELAYGVGLLMAYAIARP